MSHILLVSKIERSGVQLNVSQAGPTELVEQKILSLLLAVIIRLLFTSNSDETGKSGKVGPVVAIDDW